jgi:hypothetical protein
MKDTTMYPKPKPIRRPGSRNIHCPHYGACLDHAVKHWWEYWACCDCPHKLKQESMTEIECPVDGSDVCYRFPSDIYGKLRDLFS